MDSGWLRVARGCSRAKAPPLAARPKKVAEKIPGTKIAQYYLRRYLRHVIGSRWHCAQIRPKYLNACFVYFGWKNH